MKKWKFSVIFLAIFISINSQVFAANKSNEIDISMDGKRYSVKEVPIILDGQTIYSEIPAFIHPINNYTLIPIRFVSEHYGAEVKWDQETKTATIILENKEIKVTIDSKDVYINGEKRTIEGGTVPKLITFSNNDSRTMVPLRFISEAFGYEVGWDEKNRVPYINTLNNTIDSKEITNVKVETGDINKLKVIVEGTEKLTFSQMFLENPNRLVIDIDNTILNLGGDISSENGVGVINVNDNPINKINISQFSNKPNVVRVVIHLWEEIDFNIVHTNEEKSLEISFDKKVVTPRKDNVLENIDYFIEGGNRIVTINAKRDTKYDVAYNSDEKTMTIDIPQENIDASEGFLNIKDGFINDITVITIEEKARVILSFRRNVEYTILSKDNDNKIILSFKKDENIKTSDRLIVIDPGHGGKASGAVSPNGTKEKDVTLNISTKLNEGLKLKGYGTLMIRDGDYDVDNYERAKIANDNQADIYISIHANSVENKPDVSGIEILYCPVDPNSLDVRNNEELAKTINEELIKGVEAKNRGLVKRPNIIVLKHTKMPAVLIEVGFLTNAIEEELIKDEYYQNKMVESIINGIERYFELY